MFIFNWIKNKIFKSVSPLWNLLLSTAAGQIFIKCSIFFTVAWISSSVEVKVWRVLAQLFLGDERLDCCVHQHCCHPQYSLEQSPQRVLWKCRHFFIFSWKKLPGASAWYLHHQRWVEGQWSSSVQTRERWSVSVLLDIWSGEAWWWRELASQVALEK